MTIVVRARTMKQVHVLSGFLKHIIICIHCNCTQRANVSPLKESKFLHFFLKFSTTIFYNRLDNNVLAKIIYSYFSSFSEGFSQTFWFSGPLRYTDTAVVFVKNFIIKSLINEIMIQYIINKLKNFIVE